MTNFVGALPNGKRVYVKPRRDETLAFAVFVTRASGRTENVARITDQDQKPDLVWNGRHYERNDRTLTPAEIAKEISDWWRRHALKDAERTNDPSAVIGVHVVALRPVQKRTTT